jgi:hypothetical protein
VRRGRLHARLAGEGSLPEDRQFHGAAGDKAPVTLYGHYWYDAAALSRGTRCPAIVELNPYRRRDGLMYADSMMYPWFAANEYLCFRVDLQGTGDSEGILTDEYTEEELAYCVQVVEQIAQLPICDGNVGRMGKSWSAINALMVAARRLPGSARRSSSAPAATTATTTTSTTWAAR